MDYKPQLNAACRELAQDMQEAGFRTDWGNVPEKLMLVVTELAEAMEEYRYIELRTIGSDPDADIRPSYSSDSYNRTKAFETEIADAFIRLMSMCGALGLDMDTAIPAKTDYNRTRSHKHGKQL